MAKFKAIVSAYLLDAIMIVTFLLAALNLFFAIPKMWLFIALINVLLVVAAFEIARRSYVNPKVVKIEESGKKVYYVICLNGFVFEKFCSEEEAEEFVRKLKNAK